jgi:hypothetical protein
VLFRSGQASCKPARCAGDGDAILRKSREIFRGKMERRREKKDKEKV